MDVIKTYEDYDKTERIAWGIDKAKNDEVYAKERRIYELSQIDGMPPCIAYQIPFRHLCNLLQINAGDSAAVMKYFPDMKEEQRQRFEERAECAWYWITECAPDEFRFTLRTDGGKAALSAAETEAVRKIRDELLPQMDALDEKAFSTALYDAAHACNLEPKALFTAVYQVLIGKEQGPRLAGFMKIIGKERLAQLLAFY